MGVTEALLDIDKACLFLDIIREREPNTQQAVQLDVEMINSHFKLPVGLHLMRLYTLLQQHYPEYLPKYSKDIHKAVILTILTTDLSKVTVLIFHTGSVLLAGANGVTSTTKTSLPWGLPDALAAAFIFVTEFINTHHSFVTLPAPTKKK